MIYYYFTYLVVMLKLKAMLLEFTAGKENVVVIDDEVAGNLGQEILG